MKKILSTMIACLMLVNCFVFAVSSTEAGAETAIKQHYPLGNGTYTYRLLNEDGTPAELGGNPMTFEAVVAFPTDYAEVDDPKTGEKRPGLGGMFFGNLDGRGSSGSFGLLYGQPILQWQDDGGVQGIGDDDVKFNVVFDEIAPTEIYCGEQVHIAIVRDIEAETVTCYINGAARQTKKMLGESAYNYLKEVPDEPNLPPVNNNWRETTYVLGGDMRASNGRWFRGGTLYQVAVYSDIRSGDEIKADVSSFGSDNDNLLTYFDLRDCGEYPATVTDETGKFTAIRDRKWNKTSAERGDFAYSMAFIGDTQKLVEENPENVPYLYDWLIENKETEKISYVVGLGDITDDATIEQYDAVVDEIDRLYDAYGNDFVMPRGNHDINSIGGKDPSVYITYDDAFAGSVYESTIPVEQRMPTTDGSVPSIANCYKTVNICGVPYLILVLDVTPTDAMLTWADGVVEAHPNHNVIVTTHAYLSFDETTLDYNDFTTTDPTEDGKTSDNKNNGLEIWEKFVKKHENICLVVSGHIGYDYIITSHAEGDNKNIVTQILSDHQTTDSSDDASLGMVTMLYFMGDGETVNIETLSTVKAKTGNNSYFYESNQYSIELPLNATKFDVNGNVKTDLEDLLLVVDELINHTGKIYSDVNADGKVSLADVLRVSKYLVSAK